MRKPLSDKEVCAMDRLLLIAESNASQCGIPHGCGQPCHWVIAGQRDAAKARRELKSHSSAYPRAACRNGSGGP